MSELHHAVVTGDRFVDLLAGLHAWCAKLDALLARDTTCTERVPAEAVDVMLGAIAIRTKLATTLAASARDVSPRQAPGTARESLLR